MDAIGKIEVGVVMQRRPLANRWQPWQWRPLEVLELAGMPELAAASGPRQLLNSHEDTRWLYPGFEVELFTDEAEGYFLNLSSPTPSWFIMWRKQPDESGSEDGELGVPHTVTLSYNQAARLMDGGEQVDILPAPPHVVAWMDSFVAKYYKPEPKRKRRKPSFEGGAAVDAMARAEKEPRDVG